ncbi:MULTISPECIES: M15 family metallopeptidase [Roseomonadaceae]|uniref:M15 family metallopeptidase n=1 Tax=Falsiroseomonas oleicola TaxID=2801474 RepID=A0ABS6H4U5_9PROT|nr:M15 family metallopeptidase [Roseomonas oleicola]MBU8543705.1 M15 family metallopeptidase [Roseomonas oleicola]
MEAHDMPVWPQDTDAALDAFYGDPDKDNDGAPDSHWEGANLVAIPARWRMVASWDHGLKIRSLRIHWRCAESLGQALDTIMSHYGSQSAIEAARMHLYGGGYTFRRRTSGSRLSTHAYGAAVDFDPARNGFGVPWRDGAGMMPVPVIQAFQAQGWVWGGDWGTPDAMHFQAAIS